MPALTNKNASPEACKLYNYINSMRGKAILSGQQELPFNHNNGEELAYIQTVSGHLPAILGLDYISNDFDGVTKRSIAWHQKGGIVSICWHWGIPPYGLGYPSSQEYVDMKELLTPGTELYQGLLDNLDQVAEALKLLQSENIPVLWRPLHEFDGGWFWWGKCGSELFIELWRLMYDRYTNLHKLNNLIWVLGYSGDMHDGWYPGDEYVDIIGGDAYSEGVHAELYEFVKKQTNKNIPIAHHENGPIPEPGLLRDMKLDWSWFLTWHTIHIHKQNSADYVKYVYNHPYVLTLEDLQKEKPFK